MQDALRLLVLGLVLQTGGTMKPFASPKGEFTIDLPAKPVEKVRNLAISRQSVRLTIASAKAGSITYTAGFAELEGDDTEAALSAAREDVAKQVRGNLGEDSEAELAGLPAQAFKVEVSKQIVAGGLIVHGRTLVVGAKLYVLTAAVPAARASSSEADIKAYFDSFKAEKGPEIAAKPATGKAAGSRGMGGTPAMKGSSWNEFTIPGFQVTVKMPGAVAEHALARAAIRGLKPGKTFTARKGITAYSIVVAPIPPLLLSDANLSLLFTGVKNNVLKGSKSTEISERTFKVGGHTVFEFVSDTPANPAMNAPAAVIRMQMFVVKETSITLAAATPSGKAADADMPGFFESLQILEKAPEAEENIRWATFAPPGRGFSVEVPGTPMEAANTRSHGPDGIHVFESARGSLGYLMAVGPLAPGADVTKFGTSRDRMLQKYKLQLKTSKTLKVSGNAVMEFVGQAPQDGPFMVTRFMNDTAAKKTYILSVSGPGISDQSPEVRKFFDSLRPTGPSR